MAPLAGQLALFGRELVDLLKSHPGCRMPFHKFIPSYHHHFGRQCRSVVYLRRHSVTAISAVISMSSKSKMMATPR